MSKPLITILGAGESGLGAALLAHVHGYEVFVSDNGSIKEVHKQELNRHQIAFEEGGHRNEKIWQSNTLIKSPGIPDDASVIARAQQNNIKVIGELEFAFGYAGQSRMIVITGTNGKTTTTLLIHHLLTRCGLDAGLAGNVGKSLARQILERKHSLYVIEASSFQLDNMKEFRADTAILLNITPDHLDRYQYSFANYTASKFGILRNMDKSGTFIYFADQPAIKQKINNGLTPQGWPVSLKKKLQQGAYLWEEKLCFKLGSLTFEIPCRRLPLQGKHNYVNIMAAVLAACIETGEAEKVVQALSTFSNVPHRMEKVASIKEKLFINDSKATNVDAVFFALESFKHKVVWIAGGVDKGNDYEALLPLVKSKVKALVCLGKDNHKLIKSFTGHVMEIVETTDTFQAVEAAYQLAGKGETIILSPACASFDLFNNYEDRGDRFREAVMKLKNKIEKAAAI